MLSDEATTELPKESGWWWRRENIVDKWHVVEVFQMREYWMYSFDRVSGRNYFLDNESPNTAWLGPLIPPLH